MVQAKAIIFDYIGTLVTPRKYSMSDSMSKLHRALADEGFNTDETEFLRAYQLAHEKYRLLRYGELREVTNSVWVSETLCTLGFSVDIKDEHMNAALNAFFRDFVDSLGLRSGAEKLLIQAAGTYKVGLISNFTYAPVIYASLKKLGINQHFNSVVISQDCGWRKPHPKIFSDALKRLDVKPAEVVFVGDSPKEDIKGALEAGLKTVFVCSQFFGKGDLAASGEKPHFVAQGLVEICDRFLEIAAF